MNKKTAVLMGRSILVVILTTLITPIVDSLINSFQLFKLKLLIAAIVYSLPNLVFVWILYLTKVSRKPLLNTWALTAEIIFYYFIYFLLFHLVKHLTKTETGFIPQRWYNNEAAILVYSFTIYFLVFLLIKKLIVKRK